jgi:diguanylate cyclase (GGDEF)-like protein
MVRHDEQQMNEPIKEYRRHHFTVSLLAPVVVALTATLVGMVGFLLFVTSANDQRALDRQIGIVGRILDEQRSRVTHEQESVVVWDDAVAHTRLAFDREWVHTNLGAWMFSYFGHNRTYVLNADNRAVYAMDTGMDVGPNDYGLDRGGIARIVSRFRASFEDGRDSYTPGEAAEQVPRVADFALLRGQPALVSVMPIVSDTGDIVQAPGSEYLLVSIVVLDAAFGQSLTDRYLLWQGSFSRAGADAAGLASYPISNNVDRIVGFFQWQPDRPGTTMLGDMIPVLAAGALAAGVLIFVLLDRLWSSSSAIEAGHRQARHQAMHDPLTGMPNRAMFEEALDHALAAARRSGGQVGLLLLDLDRFKQINDTLGHQAGDATIIAVGKRLRAIVHEGDILARIGGDEYAIIARHVATTERLEMLAAAIIDSLHAPFDVQGNEAFVGVSIGIIVGDGGSRGLDLMRKADIALYEAKGQGRSRAVVYREQMSEVLQHRHAVESALREALATPGQLSVVFQPLVSARDAEIIGAEALVRWHHPGLGEIGPAEFIPVAESAGLIEPLGELVLKHAAALSARWPGKLIAVNVSPAQMRNPRFFQKVFDILSVSGMRPADLELEITENLLLDHERVAGDALRRFRTAGVRMALDDFGTGYSSLNYLKQYEVDRIKIDCSFVSQIEGSRVPAAIVRAMITLAHAMGVEVTAEGVETHEQAVVLKTMGCNAFQGYLFSAAVNEATIETMFAHATTSFGIRALPAPRRVGAPSA